MISQPAFAVLLLFAFGSFALPAADSPVSAHVLTSTQVESLVASNKNVVLLDVRTPAERSEGYIAGSTNIDFRAPDFQEKLAKLDHSKTYVVYCVRGQKRTSDTVRSLDQLGFTNLLSLEGGYSAWAKDGKPVKK